jgi:flagellin
MRINTNVASLNAQEASANTNKNITSSLEKLSSGLRINKAADDASGLAIADKLRTQASSLNQGIANANSATALIQIADKAMAEQSNILDVVKQKLIQASTSTTSDDGREAIRKDITKLLDQFDNIAGQTNYNGITLLQKDATTTSKQDELSFQLGEDDSFDVNIELTKASNTASLGGGSDTISSGTNLDGQDALYIKDTASTVTLKNVGIQLDGTDTDTLSSVINITVSGNLGTFTGVTLGTTTINASNETQATKDLLETVASGFSGATYDSTTGVFTYDGASANGAGVDLSKIDFSAAVITQGAASTLSTVEIANSTGFNVTNNLTTTAGSEKVDITTTGTDTMTGGELLSSIKNLAEDGLTAAKANSFMATIDEALTQMNTNRSDFGSTQNQLESSIRNMQTTHTNLKNAESVIRDVDYAAESANFNKQNIIAQAGTYAMSQANAMAQNVQRLLQ